MEVTLLVHWVCNHLPNRVAVDQHIELVKVWIIVEVVISYSYLFHASTNLIVTEGQRGVNQKVRLYFIHAGGGTPNACNTKGARSTAARGCFRLSNLGMGPTMAIPRICGELAS